MSNHLLGDLIYWVIFLAGECLWVLICAAAAVRSKHNPLKSRRAYVKENWDIYLIRFCVEFLVYYGWRHVALNTLLSMVNVSWQLPVVSGGPGAGGPVGAFFLGLGADSLIGAASHWQKLPEALRQWIGERIPDVEQPAPPVETTGGPTV